MVIISLGISTASFFPLETEKTLPIINELGVKTLEVFLQAEGEYNPLYIGELNKYICENNMKVTSVHGFCATYEPFIFANYKRRSDDAVNMFEKVCRAGKLLKAKYFTFHGNRADYINENFSFKEFAATMNMLSQIAGSYDLCLAWENVSWCQSGDPNFIESAIQYIDMKNIRFTLDIKQALRAGFLPEDYIKAMGSYICNVHINDWDNIGGCRMPGCGNVDLKKVLILLDELKYDGDFIIEVYRENFKKLDDFKDSILFMKGLTKNCSTIKL